MVKLSVNTILLSIISLASASSPLLAWTNKNVADVTSMNYAETEDVPKLLNPFLNDCPKSILILDQPNVDASSLANMKVVKKAIESAKSSLQIPYLDINEANNVDVIVNAITEKCSSVVVSDDQEQTENTIVIKKLPKDIKESEKNMNKLLKNLKDDSLVIYLSNNEFSSKKMLVQRQATQAQETTTTPTTQPTTTVTETKTDAKPTATEDAQETKVANVTAKAETAIFGKYVFMNNAIFEGIVAMIPVMIISIIGVTWLSSVQTPTRFEKKKDN